MGDKRYFVDKIKSIQNEPWEEAVVCMAKGKRRAK